MMFSIITVNFNNKEGLEKTLNSLADQIYTNWELIVIDGGSSDGSLELLEENKELIHHKVVGKDKGIYDAMNIGVSLVSQDSKLLHFLNSGDVFYNSNTLTEVAAVASEGQANIYGNIERSGLLIESIPEVSFKNMSADMISHQAVFFNVAIHRTLKYDIKYAICADYKMILQMLKLKVPFIKVNSIICKIEEGGVSATRRKQLHKEKEKIRNEFPAVKRYFKLKRVKRKLFG